MVSHSSPDNTLSLFISSKSEEEARGDIIVCRVRQFGSLLCYMDSTMEHEGFFLGSASLTLFPMICKKLCEAQETYKDFLRTSKSNSSFYLLTNIPMHTVNSTLLSLDLKKSFTF